MKETIKKRLFPLLITLIIFGGCTKGNPLTDKKEILNDHEVFLEHCSPFGVGNYSYCTGENTGVFFESPTEGGPLLQVKELILKLLRLLMHIFLLFNWGEIKMLFIWEKKK